ncbi:MAG: hypothetical protein ACRCX2_24010 [Paraclostridium sp.]
MKKVLIIYNTYDGEPEGIYESEQLFVGILEEKGFTVKIEDKSDYKYYDIFRDNKKIDRFVSYEEKVNEPCGWFLNSYLSRERD